VKTKAQRHGGLAYNGRNPSVKVLRREADVHPVDRKYPHDARTAALKSSMKTDPRPAFRRLVRCLKVDSLDFSSSSTRCKRKIMRIRTRAAGAKPRCFVLWARAAPYLSRCCNERPTYEQSLFPDPDAPAEHRLVHQSIAHVIMSWLINFQVLKPRHLWWRKFGTGSIACWSAVYSRVRSIPWPPDSAA